MQSAKEAWETAKGVLQVQISKANFDTWLKDTVGLSLQNGLFTVGTPSSFAKEWLERRLCSLITKVLINILGQEVEVRFQVYAGHKADLTAHASSPLPLPPLINPKYTFENFVVGASNRLAFAAALGVAEAPGRAYNPLFIYGASGVGKTHLSQAIVNDASDNGFKVVYVSSEQFTNEFVNSLKERRTEEFRNKYRNTDLLVIEDVQFIMGKPQTQETLFHTFNDLHNSNRQLVITSDRTPASLSSLDTGLWSRLTSGLVAEVEAPDWNTRLAVLQSKARQYQISIDNAVLEYIAQRCQQNVRELESCLNLVMAYASLMRKSPTLELAQLALQNICRPTSSPPITPTSILNAVADYFQIDLDSLTGRNRSQRVTLARHIAMYLIREKTNCGLTDIGRLLGGRDHSTILRGHQRIASMLSTNPSIQKTINQILETFRRLQA